MSPPDRSALKARLLREYAELLEERLPQGPMTLEEIETLVEELGRKQDARLEDLLIQEQTPPPDNQVACPACRAPAYFKRRLAREVLTIHGPQPLDRRYYRCSRCQHGFAPLDTRLGLAAHGATRRVRAWQARLGSEAPFASVPALLFELRGLVISESTVERTTVEVGQGLATAPALPGAAARRAGRGAGEERLYLGLDGVFCPLREPWKKDGSLGRLTCRYGECKVGVAYQTEHRDGLDTGVRFAAYLATLERVEGFTAQFVAFARENGSDRARELIVLGDGAEWIWKLCEAHFPRAVQIVDYWHLTEHLYQVANARFGPGTAAGKAWVRDCQWDLEHDLVNLVVRKVADWEPATEEAAHVRATEAGFFETNRERLRYGTFLRRGYHVGSGVVESSCRHVVTQRLKQAGMHWRPETAEAVLAIRARLRSTAPFDLRAYC